MLSLVNRCRSSGELLVKPSLLARLTSGSSQQGRNWPVVVNAAVHGGRSGIVVNMNQSLAPTQSSVSNVKKRPLNGETWVINLGQQPGLSKKTLLTWDNMVRAGSIFKRCFNTAAIGMTDDDDCKNNYKMIRGYVNGPAFPANVHADDCIVSLR